MPRAPAPAPLSLDTEHLALFNKNMRVDSASSDSSFESIMSSPTRASRKNKNRYTTCGRHTDQFLFGGPSLSGLARALFSRH